MFKLHTVRAIKLHIIASQSSRYNSTIIIIFFFFGQKANGYCLLHYFIHEISTWSLSQDHANMFDQYSTIDILCN